MNVESIYYGSDAEATRILYATLDACGPIGFVASNLLRACKCSERAKGYRRRCHSQEAYGRKQWSMGRLVAALIEHADTLGIRWGWGPDDTPGFPWVLYVVAPGHGQVSFHSRSRADGPDFGEAWDGIRGVSHKRAIAFAADVLAANPEARPAPEANRSATLTDESPMPFGKWKGSKVGDIPDDYFAWLLDQDWKSKWPAVRDYAKERASQSVSEEPV